MYHVSYMCQKHVFYTSAVPTNCTCVPSLGFECINLQKCWKVSYSLPYKFGHRFSFVVDMCKEVVFFLHVQETFPYMSTGKL